MRKERKEIGLGFILLNEGQLPWLPKNPRTWTQTDIDKTAASIKEDPDFLEDRPLLVVPFTEKNYIVFAGNLRHEGSFAAKRSKVPCVIYYPETEEDYETIRRRAMKDNGSFGKFDWDEVFSSPWGTMDLEAMGIGNAFQGYEHAWEGENGGGETSQPTETHEDDFNEEEDAIKVRCKPGDIWQLGEHRLMCGDSTDTGSVACLMNGTRGKILFTSPPYSDMREYNGGKDLSVDNLANFISAYRPFTDYQCVNLGIKRREHDIVEYWDEYIKTARESGYKMLAWNVWDKTKCGSVGNQSAFIGIRHEFIFVFGTEYFEINKTWEKAEGSTTEREKLRRVRDKDGTYKLSSAGDLSNPFKRMESVVQILPEQGEIIKEHPATFPVKLPAEYINAMTQPGEIVIEPFCGAGTTLIAAEQLGRVCYGMELDPHYCDIILARWEKLTGRKAEKVKQ